MKPVFLSYSLQVPPLILAVTLFCKTDSVLSQPSNIVPDNTLGDETSQVVENFNDQPIEVITGGAQREQNLFHSFQEFNVSEGRGAYFNSSDVNIQNIFSRVTGGNPSEIMGVLGTFGESNPNLYLINPNGILFGENASLDMGGSFAGTTASGIEFGEQGTYSAINPQLPQLLTVDPSAYLFNQIENQAISGISNQADLEVAPGESLVFFGGNINLINSSLVAPGGEIILGSVENITLVDTFINVSSGGGGFIVFDAQNLVLENSIIGAGIAEGAGNPDAVTGDIVINVTEKLSMDDSYIANLLFENGQGTVGNIEIFAGSVFGTRGATIDSSSSGQGNAGIITITATSSVVFDGKDIDGTSTGIFSAVDSKAIGNAGDIFITSRSLEFTNGAQLGANTDGRGNAGDINIDVTDSIVFDGENDDGRTSGAFNFVESNAEGNAGNINISSGSLRVLNGAELTTSTTGIGNGGSITINVTDSVVFDGESNDGIRNSGAFSDVTFTATGSAGNISITTDSLRVLNGAKVSSGTDGVGNAGSITISATDLALVDGIDRDGNSSTINSQVESGAKGNAGDITVNVHDLKVTDSAQISASTFGTGDGGSITINAADSILLDGKSQFNSTAIGGQVALGSRGKGADILISTNYLRVIDGAQVSSETFGTGSAGSITINATNSMVLDGEDLNGNNSRVSSSVTSEAEGNAGDVSITTDSLEVLDGAQISTSTFGQGNAGSVDIIAIGSIVLDGYSSDGFGSVITSQVNSDGIGNAGGINISTNLLQILSGSRIDASTFSKGDASQIKINATNSINIDGESSQGFVSGIFSAADTNAEGNAGGITIFTKDLTLDNSGEILSSTFGQGKAGKLEINADSINLDNGSSIVSRSESAFDAGNISLSVAKSLQATDSFISTSSSQSSGGNLTITAGDVKLLGDSDITTNITSGEGSGGNIAIETDSIIAFDDSDIFAFAADGQGGNITLNTPAFFAENFTLNSLTSDPEDLEDNNRPDINATGAVSGVVDIPDVSFIQNSLTELPDNSINTNELVANSCVSPVGNRQQGKFIITGGDSLPVRPGNADISAFATGDVRGVSEVKSGWQRGDEIVEPQGVYRLANGKLILSRECNEKK